MLYVETKVTTTLDMYKNWNKTNNSEDPTDTPTILGFPLTIPTEAPNLNYNSKFSDDDIRLLREFLVNGEKYKWKQVTKEINSRSLIRRYETTYEGGRHPGPKSENDEGAGASNSSTGMKNVSPTFVMKQYQARPCCAFPNPWIVVTICGGTKRVGRYTQCRLTENSSVL